MKIASFNINGIRARLPALLDWLADARPDVVVLQEIKSLDDGFPRLEIEEMGYNIETHGQKGFNGVAILSKTPLEDVTRGLPGDDADDQARWIEATVVGARSLRICGLYLPNGNPAPGPKYDYKLAWMDRLRLRADSLLADETCAILAGDFNVIPQPKDCHDPAVWAEDALFLPPTRAAFQRVTNLGLTDALRAVNPNPGVYTFWDYQAGAWPKKPRHPHRPCPLDPASRRHPGGLRHRRRDPRPRKTLRPRADLGRVGPLIPRPPPHWFAPVRSRQRAHTVEMWLMREIFIK